MTHQKDLASLTLEHGLHELTPLGDPFLDGELLIVRGLEDDGVFLLAGHCGCGFCWGKGVRRKFRWMKSRV